MAHENEIVNAKLNAAMDDRALAHLQASHEKSGQAALASLQEAADAAVYEDTIERVIARAEQIAESDEDARAQAEEIAAKLARRRDAAKARLAS